MSLIYREKLIFKNYPGAVIGPILLAITLALSLVGPISLGEATDTLTSEKVNLNINETFSLDDTESIVINETFSLTQKQEVYLLHIKCQSTEDMVKSVYVSVTINGIATTKTFEDSSYDYNSPYVYLIGTTLVLEIDSVTPIYVLSNSLTLELEVATKGFLLAEKGSFQIQEVIFEALTPPDITTSSQNVPLTLQISKGHWYLGSYTTLSERGFETKIFDHIAEDMRARIDISLTPSDLPLTSTKFVLITPYYSFESNDSTMENSIIADLTKGDILLLDFKFRPTSEMADDIVELSISVTVTYFPVEQEKAEDWSILGFRIPNLPALIMTGIRLSVIIIPVLIFYKRKKKSETSKETDLMEKK